MKSTYATPTTAAEESLPLGRLKGKNVLLIGGTKGIGRATAEKLAAEGANLLIGDIDPGVEKTVSELSATYRTVKVLSETMNITSAADCHSTVARTAQELGSVDVLVIASGILNEPAEVADLPLHEWERVFAVNVTGPFLMGKAVAPVMKGQQHGRIVNIASFWGREGQAFYSAYCSSKAALLMLTQSQAAELAPYGITVNSVSPGMTNTEMHQRALVEEAAKRGLSLEEFRAQEYAHIPLGKSGDPVDIANAVLFLSTDEAKYITGTSIDVNGGVQFR